MEALKEKRIAVLDGLRGVAITLVVFYHTFSLHGDVIPWANTYHSFPIFKLGFLGVQLFFLISGFVIYMSLENSNSFKSFIYKRWLRLFPAMLIATIFIFSYAVLFIDKFGYPRPIDALPGLLFVEPTWLSFILDTKVSPLEGSFWTLFVEFKFYFIFGISYFYFRKHAINILTALFLGALLCELTRFLHLDYLIHNYAFTFFKNFVHFGWFVAGAWFYEARKNQLNSSYMMSAIAAVLSCLYMGLYSFNMGYGSGFGVTIAALMIYLLFVSSFYIAFLKLILSSKVFVLIGFISYPLYLIHEMLMIKLTTYFHATFPFIPDMLTPIMALSFIFLFAWIIAVYAEPSVRKIIKNLFPLPAKIILAQPRA